MNGRLDLMVFLRASNYRMTRFLETELNSKALAVPATFPMEMSRETKGLVADVSLRHAAVAAGLGVLGRNSLVYHPRFKNKVIFLAILTDTELEADLPVQNKPCTGCISVSNTVPQGP